MHTAMAWLLSSALNRFGLSVPRICRQWVKPHLKRRAGIKTLRPRQSRRRAGYSSIELLSVCHLQNVNPTHVVKRNGAFTTQTDDEEARLAMAWKEGRARDTWKEICTIPEDLPSTHAAESARAGATLTDGARADNDSDGYLDEGTTLPTGTR